MQIDKLRNWMADTIATEGYLHFRDLHIDELDAAFRRRDRWVRGAVQSLRIALLHRNAASLPFTVAVGFSMLSGPERQGLDIEKFSELVRHLDFSPPSLYLFPYGNEPWTTDENFVEWQRNLALRTNLPIHAYFREWYEDEDDEFRRSFWLLG